MPDYTLDAGRCALIVQDLQNDVIIEGGAFAESGSPEHAKEQNVVENVKDLAAFCRGKGIPVIHVWYIVEEGAPGLKLNAPLFQGVKDAGALVRGTWGAAPADGLEAQDGDFVVEKMRMSAWQGTRLENLLTGLGRDTVIVTGAWTNMSIEHTSRTGADKGFSMVVPEDGCSTMNADWHNASINYALQNVSTVTNCADVKAALGGASAICPGSLGGSRARPEARGGRWGNEDPRRALPCRRRAARGRRARPRRPASARGRRPHGGGRDLRNRPPPGEGGVPPPDADGARSRGRRCRRGGRRRGHALGWATRSSSPGLRRAACAPTAAAGGPRRAAAQRGDPQRHAARRHDRDVATRRDRVPRHGHRLPRRAVVVTEQVALPTGRRAARPGRPARLRRPDGRRRGPLRRARRRPARRCS